MPVAVGENVTGEISPATPRAVFSLSIDMPQNVVIQVLSLGSQLEPTFRVIDPSGVVLQGVDNATGRSNVEATVSLTGIGAYRIEVAGSFGTSGGFLLSIREGDPLDAPEPLLPGDAITERVDANATRQAYLIDGNPSGFLVLIAESRSGNTSPVFLLRSGEGGDLLGSAGATLGGARFRLPPGDTSYLLEVLFSGAASDYFVCLENENGAVRCPGSSTPISVNPTVVIPPTQPVFATSTLPPLATSIPLPTINPTGACMVATAGTTTVNVRSGPGTNFSILTQLSPFQTGLVLGRLADGTWYQINVNSITGWVSGTVVRVGGMCAAISIIIPPTLTPTATLPMTFTPSATLMATNTPTATATLPGPQPTLNFSLPPNYGSTALTSGFVPDPFQVGITSGGSVNVTYLGSGCRGFATAAPDFSVNYTSGAFPTLRFYFIGSGDSTMVINSPSGSYFCNDDSFGTLNPTIDFSSPSSGRYDIWIGSFSSGTFISGTLSVTESTGNHP
ncbi:MAG: SH3 domain-containing protein [Anaerolinea sp.]|nr:SH3 domain-containing protein [Anaerolinea sp.]